MNQRVHEWLKPWGNWRHKRFWLLVVVIAWTLFGFFGAPPLVERAVQQTIRDTGREVTIEGVRVNPYVLSLAIDGFEIRDPDTTPLVQFERLFVNFQLSSLFRWAWTFAEIRLTGLHVEEERFQSGNTRLAQFTGDLAGEDDMAGETPEDDSLPRVIIHNVVLEQGSFGITDQLAGGFQERFGPVSVSASDLRTLPDHAGNKAVSITTPEGGVISWEGDLHLVPLASSGHLTIEGKSLPAALRYAGHFLPVSIEGEALEMSFDYSLQTRQEEFRVAVDNLDAGTGALRIRMDKAEQPFLDIRSIGVTNGSLRWPEQTVDADALVIEGPQLDTSLNEDGALNLLEAFPDEEGIGQSPDDEDSRWVVKLKRLALTDGAVEFEDRSIARPGRLRLRDIDLTLREVASLDETEMPTELSLRLESGGTIGYSGSVVLRPDLRLDGQTAVSGLALPVFQPWIKQYARIELEAGTVDLEADIAGSPEALTLGGRTAVKTLELQDTARGQRLAALEEMEVERFELDLGKSVLRTSPVVLKGAYGRVHIYEDLSTNLGGLAIEPSEGSEQTTAEETEDDAIQITIAGVEIEEGALDFADDSLPLPFSTSIRSLEGNLSTLSTASAEPSAIDLEGQVNEYGEARIEGTLNPWDFTQSADIELVFRNLQMSSLTPYTIQYAGYAIEEGRLDLDLRYVLDQRKLRGENNIVIRELVLGEKVETSDGTSLPLKLAVALLTDSEGVIDVDLPISGDLDDPAFRISGIVWKAVGNLITKIVTSPFRFLGRLVGVDSEDFGTLSFQPGRADVSPPDREQLSKLAEAMASRPELRLVVTGAYNERLDRPALQAQAFDSRFEARRAAMLESGEAEPIDADRPALEALFAEQFPDTPLGTVRADFTSTPIAQGESEGESGGASAGEPVLDEPAYLAELRSRLIEAQNIGTEQLRALGAERAVAVFQSIESNAGEDPLAVAISDEVKAVEAEGREVELELEIEVREAEAS